MVTSNQKYPELKKTTGRKNQAYMPTPTIAEEVMDIPVLRSLEYLPDPRENYRTSGSQQTRVIETA